jgi:accessory gene regulator B
METLAHNIAEKIAMQMDFNEDRKAVIAYGLTAILQMAFIFVVITIIGAIFDFWYESLIIFFGVGIIRKSTGGAHSHTMNGCIIISILSVTILSALSRYLFQSTVASYINVCISIVIYIICFIVFYQRVPVASPNKPIVKPEKIKRLRKQSFIILTIFFILSMLAGVIAGWNDRFYSIAVIIRLTMLWQLFTLTQLGIRLFNKIDDKLNFVIFKR